MKQNFDSQELLKHLKKGELSHYKCEKEDIESKLSALEEQILEESFEFDIKFTEDYYFLEDLPQKLILRKLNDNIKRIYKDEQSNRKFIIQQVKTLLNETAPFWVIKSDIKSFYDSIDRERIFRKLKKDAILSYYSIFLLRKIFDNKNVEPQLGLPRGLNISSSLSEMYMRNFDKAIQRYEDVFYYARFVDDIIIFVNNKKSALDLYQNLENILSNETQPLQINKEKTELIDGLTLKVLKNTYNKGTTHNVEYLGYQFYISNNTSKTYNVSISIAKKKVKKIKTRIVKSYVDYSRTNNFELLKKRVKFLTGNYGIGKSGDGSILKAGIYYNYTHINDLDVLEKLNSFHRKIIYSKKGSLGIKLNTKLTNNQRKCLKRFCFISGFKKKIFNTFTFVEMGEITQCW